MCLLPEARCLTSNSPPWAIEKDHRQTVQYALYRSSCTVCSHAFSFSHSIWNFCSLVFFSVVSYGIFFTSSTGRILLFSKYRTILFFNGQLATLAILMLFPFPTIQASRLSEFCEWVLGTLGEAHQGGHPFLCCVPNTPEIFASRWSLCCDVYVWRAVMTSSLDGLLKWAKRFSGKEIWLSSSVYLPDFSSTFSNTRLSRSLTCAERYVYILLRYTSVFLNKCFQFWWIRNVWIKKNMVYVIS